MKMINEQKHSIIQAILTFISSVLCAITASSCMLKTFQKKGESRFFSWLPFFVVSSIIMPDCRCNKNLRLSLMI